MEGAYNKIFAASGSIPTPDYAHFMTMLNATVRDEIAACVERGYKHLGTKDAAKLLDVDASGWTSSRRSGGGLGVRTAGRSCFGRRRRRRARRTFRACG